MEAAFCFGCVHPVLINEYDPTARLTRVRRFAG